MLIRILIEPPIALRTDLRGVCGLFRNVRTSGTKPTAYSCRRRHRKVMNSLSLMRVPPLGAMASERP